MSEKKLEIAISEALAITIDPSRLQPLSVQHGGGQPDPLSLIAGAPVAGNASHGGGRVALPGTHTVSSVEVRRAPNGDLIVTLHE